MNRSVSEVSLEYDFNDTKDVDESSVEELKAEALDGITDNLPHLVFLVPGIRTNGLWAQEIRTKEQLWDGRDIRFVPIRGNGANIDRLSTFHLLFRLGLSHFRKSFITQIQDVVSRTEYATINIFAHSMGSALFADILGELVDENSNLKINTIVFLGSVCHRKHSRKLYNKSDLFVNDVGEQDYWPYVASVIRPRTYGDVGSSGFLNAHVYDRFFSHNHSSCISMEHLDTYLVPLISDSDVKTLGIYSLDKNQSSSSSLSSSPYNLFIYLRRALWLVFALFCMGIIYIFSIHNLIIEGIFDLYSAIKNII